MPTTGDVLEQPELDRIDDELFATDYRSPSQRRHRSVLPEPPTVRLLPAGSADQLVLHDPASPYTRDENGTEIVALIGIAVLVVVGVAAAVIILIWWA